jgi:hypothetical protein
MPIGRIALLALVLIAVAAGGSALAGAGETGATAKRHPAFADRLAAALALPAPQVRKALRAVRHDRRAERAARRALRAQQRRHAGTRAERRKRRAERRTRRAERRRERGERRRLAGGRPALRALRRITRARDRLAPGLAAKLHVEPAKVTAALRTVLAGRLDRAVARGRLTAGGRAAALACFDDASKCHGLRARLRHP